MRLPDDVLEHSGGSRRANNWAAHNYTAASAWTQQGEAQSAAQALRNGGGLARTTREILPLRAKGWARTDQISFKTPPERRYMWVVWSAQKPAHADQTREEARAS